MTTDNTEREELEPREIVRVEQRTQTDCLRCCLAMVTAIDYDDVPDFVADHGESWPTACEAWLSELGMGLLMMPTAPTYVPPWLPIIARASTECSDVHHFVVVTPNAVIDPSSSQHGLKEAAATYAVINSPLRRAAVAAPRGDAFTAYDQAVEDAKAAIREASQGGGYWAATFINAIARRCNPHVYVNSLESCSLGHSICKCGDGCDAHLDGYGCQQCDCAEYAPSSPAAPSLIAEQEKP